MMALAILGGVALVYFIVATAVGITTYYDPFLKSTPLGYRIFLWPAAKIWLWMTPTDI